MYCSVVFCSVSVVCMHALALVTVLREAKPFIQCFSFCQLISGQNASYKPNIK